MIEMLFTTKKIISHKYNIHIKSEFKPSLKSSQTHCSEMSLTTEKQLRNVAYH
jgi:hypothetical protein